MRARNAAVKNKAISHQQTTTSTSSALERAIFDHKSLSAKVDDTSKGASSPSHIATVASTSATASARPTGKVIVLQYAKKSSNTLATIVSPQIVASNLRFRPVIRCVACKQVIGSNHLLAKKCVKCDHWCHHICSHSCDA
uniref:Phorbol-ester/DAG-type domain-containing protein n=1 Tax=Plectus sambesii TaxID=2011161 RepID=A0A914W4A2_9BILA